MEVAGGSAAYDLGEKLRLYERDGVRECGVVLLAARQIRWHHLDGGSFAPVECGDDGVYRSRAFSGFWLNQAALFDGDTPGLLATLGQGMGAPEHAAFVQRLRRP